MLSLSKSERFFLLTLLILGLFLTGLLYYRKATPAPGFEIININESHALININAATAIELERLPGIGPVLATRIVEHRESAGGFRDIEELKNVKGIAAKKFEKIKDLIIISE